MIPIENSLAGRVADVHHLLPEANLFIVGEHFLPIRFQLMTAEGRQPRGHHRHLQPHPCARAVPANHSVKLGAKAHVSGDTAGAARHVAEWGDPTKAALAPALAAEIYGLEILATDVEDAEHNTTRFVILAAEPDDAEPGDGPFVTTFIFRVRNVPAALYKAMGGFATNGVNMTKLESYQVEGAFTATMFYADIDGHPSDRNVRLALEELSFFSSELTILGTYQRKRAARRDSGAASATRVKSNIRACCPHKGKGAALSDALARRFGPFGYPNFG